MFGHGGSKGRLLAENDEKMTKNIKVEESVGGVRSVVFESNKLDECLSFCSAKRGSIEGAIISRHKGFAGEDLSFLGDIPWIKRLVIADNYQNVSAVESLESLEYLQLCSSLTLDFSKLINLRGFSGGWFEGNESFRRLINLREMWLWGNRNKINLSGLAEFKNLQSLELTQFNLNNLGGVEGLLALSRLGIFYCRELNGIASIGKSSKLREVEFENCKKVNDFSMLATLSNLERVAIENCGEIESIDFVVGLSNLRALTFYGTSIKSNDLSSIEMCSSLEVLGFNSKKTYNLTLKKIQHALNIKDLPK